MMNQYFKKHYCYQLLFYIFLFNYYITENVNVQKKIPKYKVWKSKVIPKSSLQFSNDTKENIEKKITDKKIFDNNEFVKYFNTNFLIFFLYFIKKKLNIIIYFIFSKFLPTNPVSLSSFLGINITISSLICLFCQILKSSVKIMCYLLLIHNNMIFNNLYFAYTNQPIKFINNDFINDSNIIDQFAKKTKKFISIIFYFLLPYGIAIYDINVMFCVFSWKNFFFIFGVSIFFLYYLYKKIQQLSIYYFKLEYLDFLIYKKSLEFEVNIKQIKSLGKTNYFFYNLKKLKKKYKKRSKKIKNQLKNNLIIYYIHYSFLLYGLIIFYRAEFNSNKSVLNINFLFNLAWTTFTVFNIKNILKISSCFKKILQLNNYIKNIVVKPMEDKPYINFKSDGNIIITNGNNPRLENINMTIDTNKGNIFAILGESGSGKTSLCNAMTGNADFSNKSISFSGCINDEKSIIDNNIFSDKNIKISNYTNDKKINIFIEDLHPDDLKSTILLLRQEGLMFEGSIKYNLSLNDKGFSDEEMVNVLDLVGLGSLLLEKGIEIYLNEINKPINEFNVKQLMENPDPQFKIQLKIKGLQYECGVLGSRLSGGQRQKLSIARLLLRKPKILVLDEPTTGFDPISSIEFMNNIKLLSDTMKAQGNPITIILITHDLDLVAKFANYIFFMRKNYNNKGEIAEEGDPKQLLINKKSNFALQYFALKDKNY